MKIAKQFDDKQLEGRVNLHYGQHYDEIGEPHKVIEYCQMAEELAQGTGDQRTEFRAVNLAATTRISQWNVAQGRSLKARATEIAVDIHHTIGIREAAQFEWEFALWTGDWKRANEIVSNPFEGEGSGDLLHGRLTELHAYTGKQFTEKDMGMGSHIASISKLSPSRRIAIATTILTLTGDASVVEHLDISLELARAPVIADEHRLMLMARSSRALAVNDDESIPRLYDELSRFSGWWNISTGTAIDHMLGMLASRLGRYDEVENHFERAIRHSRDAGFRPTLALVSTAYVEMLRERNSTGDLAMAGTVRTNAMAIATELRMQWLVDRIIHQDELLALRVNAAKPNYPAGLTLREVEVVNLMAQGKTTNEIAKELVISRHTVARHTTNLYTKINARNRAEATAFALSELVPPIRDESDK
jgi:DNA-binding CsgD family transcriptional regulator